MATKKSNNNSMPTMQKPILEQRKKTKLIEQQIELIVIILLTIGGFLSFYIFTGAMIKAPQHLNTMFLLLSAWSVIITMMLSYSYFKKLEE